MTKITTCIRCGKTRQVEKTWTKKVNGAATTYTRTVCPDAECQKIVEEQIEAKRERLRQVQEQSLKRRANLRRKKPTTA